MGTSARLRWLGLAIWIAAASVAGGQQTAAAPATAGSADPMVEAAQEWIGRSLILHGLYGGTDLVFDAQGHVQGNPIVVDWTLAGMHVEKVSRSEAGVVLLEGLRVATRYLPDQRQFERHPQKDERLRVSFPAKDVAGMEATLAAVFSVGIDPVLQRATPNYWKHYFLPGTPWTGEDAVGPVLGTGGAGLPAGLVMPVMTTKGEPASGGEAQRDKVRGVVQVRVVVGTDGIPRQITVRQPLGYGLDAATVAAVAKSRFTPGKLNGGPVVVEMIVNQPFDVGR